MLRKLGWTVALGAAVVGLALVAGQAGASVIWNGDPARGKSAVFGIDNCTSPGSITAVKDPGRGPAWRFTKPAKDKRCEAHGIKVGGRMFKFDNNATYYIAWDFELSNTTNNNAIFQWKSYGHHIQNFPLVLKMQNGKLTPCSTASRTRRRSCPGRPRSAPTRGTTSCWASTRPTRSPAAGPS